SGQLVFQGIGAGVLDGGRIHAGSIKRAQLLVGRLGGRGGSGGEAVDDAVQRLVVALDQLGEAAVDGVLGRERGAGQPAAVRKPIEILTRGARCVEVGGVEAVVALGCERGGATEDGKREQTAAG